ncbi:unnamed protein product, partial [Prorocentrum cordatum]
PGLDVEGGIPPGDMPLKGRAAEGQLPYRRLGLTPLHVAAAENHEALLRLLLARRADPNRTDYRGCPPLLKAAERGSRDLVVALLESRANLWSTDRARKFTALHSAAKAGNLPALEALLLAAAGDPSAATGAPPLVNLLDRWNRAPLHWAVVNAHSCCAERLVRGGATVRGGAVERGKLRVFAAEAGAGGVASGTGPRRRSRQEAALEDPWELATQRYGEGGGRFGDILGPTPRRACYLQRLMRWRALASVLLCSVRQASGGIFLHTLDPDGAFREVRCETLADCLREGVATPAMVLHRSWALEIEAALQRSRGHVAGLNASALLARQAQVRETLRRRVLRAAPPQEPPPLRLVRRYTDEDRGVEVSLILLEAWEGHDVPAAIFAPIGHRSSGSPSPGVLHIPGHLAASWRDPAEQEVMLGLVARGYVVLTFDTLSQGERQQYGRGNDLECGFTCEEDGGFASVGGKCSTAHDHFGKQLWLLGRSAAELFLRDAQRALDLLAAVPGVDPGRLGVVGCSGGGMLTAYLAAVDSRVAAACVACYFSTLGRELEHGTCSYDAEQILWKQVNLGIDKPDLLAARAPQPTLVMLTTHDCFPIRQRARGEVRGGGPSQKARRPRAF